MAGDGRPSGRRRKDGSVSENAPEPGMTALAGDSSALGTTASRRPRFFKRTFVSLEERHYRNLWLGMLFQMSGMQMQSMVLGWFVFNMTGSIGLLGVVMAANGLPTLLFGPIGGVLADRLEKKRVVQAGHITSMSLVLFLGVSVSTGTITCWRPLWSTAPSCPS